jgi:hypothetical protein
MPLKREKDGDIIFLIKGVKGLGTIEKNATLTNYNLIPGFLRGLGKCVELWLK